MATLITNFSRLRLDGELGAGETVLQAQNGVTKLFNRPTTDAFVLQVKGEPTSVSGTFFGIETTIDHKPSTATSALGVRGSGSVCRLAATYTMTGGGLVGGYSQICNLGTLNGAGIINAAHYSLIEDGGTFTAVSHNAVEWWDSHLTKTITAGTTSFGYITNNGTTQFDNVWYIYPGNKITNLFTIDSVDAGLVSAKTDADIAYAHYRKVNVKVHGETGWLLVGFDA